MIGLPPGYEANMMLAEVYLLGYARKVPSAASMDVNLIAKRDVSFFGRAISFDQLLILTKSLAASPK